MAITYWDENSRKKGSFISCLFRRVALKGLLNQANTPVVCFFGLTNIIGKINRGITLKAQVP